MYTEVMSESTTVRVARTTRDHLNQVSSATGRSADETIQEGLRLIEREQWRRTAEWDSVAAGLDTEDQAEVRAAIADVLGS